MFALPGVSPEFGEGVAQLLIIVLVAGILAQIISGLLRLPSIIFLLLTGVAMGPDGFRVIDPAKLGPGLEVLVRLSVAFILFEGSMALRLRDIRRVQLSVRRLITVGVVITFVLAGLTAHFIGGLEWRYSALFGALVTVTGPTVIRPIVRRIKMRPEVGAILEGEGILADPVGAILAAVCLEYALVPQAGVAFQAQEFGLRMGIGAGVGAATGFLAGFIVKTRMPTMERIKPLVVLACAFGGYGVAESLRHESGIMAVVAAGLAIQHGVASHDRALREFKELITTLLLSVLFVLLAANLKREKMMAVGWEGLATVLTVMFVIRPVNIFACTWGGRVTLREKVFLSWVAPRGIVAASVASLGALLLAKAEQPRPNAVESLVFLTIFMTVILQGSTAKIVAWMLGITIKEARAIVIVGANRIGRAIAAAYVGAGKQVTLIDRNPVLVEEAQRADLVAIQGDGTDREVLHHARIEEADLLLAITGSSAVNQSAAHVALHDHEMEHVYISLTAGQRDKLDPVLARQGVELAMGRPIPMDAWLHDLGRGEARLLELEVTEQNVPKRPIGEIDFSELVVPLFVRRAGRVEICRASLKLQAGDRLTVLSRHPEIDALRRTLGIATAPAAAAK